jgi:hypothetical protein
VSYTLKNVKIEIGYESQTSDAQSTTEPPMWAVLRKQLGSKLRDWATPADVNRADQPKNDTWASELLQNLVDGALGKSVLTIDETRRACLSDSVGSMQVSSAPSGTPGTICRLVIEQGQEVWVNSRSYVLRTKDDMDWPEKRDPDDAIVFATVSWRCWPKS